MARKNKTFSTTFYAVFTLQTIDDCAYYLATIIFFRLTPSGTLVLNFFNTGWGTVAISAVGYFVYVEFVAHAAIALNRYVAMVYPGWSYLNRTKYRWLAIGVVLLVPLPGVSVRFTSQMELVQTENGYAINDRNKWASEVGTTISMAYCLITCLVCVVFDLKTLAAYKRMSAVGRKERQADFCLLRTYLCLSP
ncbi:hypothetical protein AAVH_29787 [Aphelenchoides avenae]|nr:hypothetical protein AAVH_29787 [Aphelenchus avenae]